jgi:hypothetical protein
VGFIGSRCFNEGVERISILKRITGVGQVVQHNLKSMTILKLERCVVHMKENRARVPRIVSDRGTEREATPPSK